MMTDLLLDRSPENPASETVAPVIDWRQKDARDRFLSRRDVVEKSLREGPSKIETIETPEGGRIRVISQIVEIPNNFQSPDKDRSGPREVLVYIPGLSRVSGRSLDLGSAPEIHAVGLIDGGTDAVIYVKPEGLNSQVFTGVEGHPQQRTSEAAMKVIMEYVTRLKNEPDFKGVVFKIAGTSEGGTMAASIAARMVELIEGGNADIGIRELVAISGGGIVGPDNIRGKGLRTILANIGQAMGGVASAEKAIAAEIVEKVAKKKSGTTEALKEPTFTLKDEAHYVSGELVGVTGKRALGDGFEGALGQRGQDIKLDDKNFMQEFTPIAVNGLGIPTGAPIERLTAVIGKNPDWKTVARAGIPTVVALATKDIFFPITQIREGLKTMREQFPDWRLLELITNVEHKHFHQGSQGLAGVIKAITDATPGFRRIVGVNQNA